MIHLNARDTRPIYIQIMDGFRQQIAAGILQPGEKLPSVRELAAQLAINPNTIQRAYRDLEAGGWVVSEAGRGSFVRGIPNQQREALLKTFEETAAALRALGVTVEELTARLQKGGTDHA